MIGFIKEASLVEKLLYIMAVLILCIVLPFDLRFFTAGTSLYPFFASYDLFNVVFFLATPLFLLYTLGTLVMLIYKLYKRMWLRALSLFILYCFVSPPAMIALALMGTYMGA